ncbi:cytosine methyltransferase [environmental Halophage eHP-30]|nr:cytosine methyltransferase [environmental Halophage eHP-30]
MQANILTGDAITKLKELPDQSIQTVITSPPYFGLRDYGVDRQIGMEATPEAYVNNLVAIFRHVWPKLRDDGTVWLNLGDSYNGSGGAGGDYNENGIKEGQPTYPGRKVNSLKQKDLIGIPWRVAFALQQDGWYLRQDIIWHKPAPMPESITDRCTKAHEYIFLLSKSESYYYDHEAIKENADHPNAKASWTSNSRMERASAFHSKPVGNEGNGAKYEGSNYRNKRSVWTVNPKPFKEAHFAVFPPELIEPCVLAGAPEGGMVCDVFAGSGTTGEVALRANRNATLIEMNPEYVEIMNKRLKPLLEQQKLI